MRLPAPQLLLAFCCATTGCVHQTRTIMMSGAACANAPARLNELWKELHEAVETPSGCDLAGGTHCDALEAEISRLALNCPANPEVLMANALLAFQAHDLVRAQQLLDQLLALQVNYPEAVSLRARIALMEGNLRFAIRFLEEQLHRFGDAAGLRETYASALYLSYRWNDARDQLGIAAKLGAPAWRVQYGLGLIDEGQQLYAEAKAHYQDAVLARPGWNPPAARLRALAAAGRIVLP